MKRILARVRPRRTPNAERAVVTASPSLRHELWVGPMMARGGMATICLGLYQGSPVAIKRLHPHLAGLPEMVATLRDEVRIGARLQHPNVLAPLALYGDPAQPVALSPYVHGEALSVLLRRGGAVPAALGLRIILDVLAGLEAAHTAKGEEGRPLGLVHRDVTPHNVLVGVDGVARIIDFGIAQYESRYQTTKAGDVKGKFPYLSPEQLRSEQVSQRTDIYACAAVLWEMLAGRRLFDGEHEASVISDVLAGRIPRMSDAASGIDPRLDLVFARALSRDARHRYASADEMAHALRGIGRIASAREVGVWVADLARSALYERELALGELERARRSCFVYGAAPREPDRGTPVEAKQWSLVEPTRKVRQSEKTRHISRRRDALALLLSCIFFGGVCVLAARGAAGAPKAEASSPPRPELHVGAALDGR